MIINWVNPILVASLSVSVIFRVFRGSTPDLRFIGRDGFGDARPPRARAKASEVRIQALSHGALSFPNLSPFVEDTYHASQQ